MASGGLCGSAAPKRLVMPSKLQLFYADHHEVILPEKHRFPMHKYRMTRERLATWPQLRLSEAAQATPAQLKLAHEPDYVERFISGQLDPKAMRHIGLPWSPSLVARTLAACGGTIAAAQHAIKHGFGGNLAGGTHHAFYDHGEGFCVFNDQAIALRVLRAQGIHWRVAFLDLDVHQGNGTAAMLTDDADTFTISIHAERNYPFRKIPSDLDLGLPDDTHDEAYLDALIGVMEVMWRFEPELIFYQAGVDALAQDALGRLTLSHDGLKARDQLVFEACYRRNIPIIVTLGGGYATPIEDTVTAYTNTYAAAVEVFGAR